MRAPDADQICGLCDEFDVAGAAPEYAALGMGRCPVRVAGGYTAVHVAWDSVTCVSFRLDRASLKAKRQFVAVQRRAAAVVEGGES